MRHSLIAILIIVTTLFGVLCGVAAAGGGACAADIDDSGAIDVNDLLEVISDWGPCPQPCSASCAADVDDSCAVDVNDLLAVISAWGLCVCEPDDAEPNDAEPNDLCTNYTVLPSVGSNQTLVQSQFKLHDAADIDLYLVHAAETDSSCSCCDFWCLDEDYQFHATLSVPADSDVPYSFGIGTQCATMTVTQAIAPGASHTWTWTLDGGCPGNDSYTFYVRVAAASAGSPGCAPYTLTFNFDPGCY